MRAPTSPAPIALHDPVAQVRIESPLPQLDRVFDYAVPARMESAALPGVRARVRFSGRLVNAFIVARSATTDIDGPLRPLERVLGAEAVLRPEILQLAEATADRYAGTVWDVLRAAIPPRHARAEAAVHEVADLGPPLAPQVDPWSRYRFGTSMIERLRSGAPLRGVWSCAPGGRWAQEIAAAVRVVLEGPTGGVIVVVPDAWDVRQALAALPDIRPSVAVLTADLGPERRYREFLRVLRGQARVVIGTRSAVFAPVPDCRLIVVWNDGDDALWEPHAPYWNARDVAALRSHQGGSALLVGSPGRSAEAQSWCQSGWARSLDPIRSDVRRSGPIIRALDANDEARDPAAASARIPHVAWLVAKEGLGSGPVLVQTPRRGYLPTLACQSCREVARCPCGGPLMLKVASGVPACAWCGALSGSWSCPSCGADRLRAAAVGVERTAEEFGRAFPGTAIIWSAGEAQRRSIDAAPALVVATPGSEPLAEQGYAAVVILDARSQAQRVGLRSVEETVHRWFSAAMLARPRAPVVITADHALIGVQALVRWDASWLATRELQDRQSAGLPPARRFASIAGEADDLADVVSRLDLPHVVLGPADGRALIAVNRELGADLAKALRSISVTRATRGRRPVITVLDPRDL